MSSSQRSVLFAATEVFATGGIQRFNRNLMEAWRQNKVKVTLLTLNEAAISNSVREQFPDCDFISAGGNKLHFVIHFFSSLVTGHYRHVVCGHLHLAMLTVMLCMLTMQLRKTTLILHGVEVWGRISGLKPYVLCYLNQVLAVSNYTRLSFLEQVPGFDPAKAKVFPNTINGDLQTEALPKRQPGSGMFRLLSVTRLASSERDKGLRDVLTALSTLVDTDFHYKVVGDGDDRVNLEREATALGIADRVEFCGRLDDEGLWNAYAESDVFILPSRKEGFGIVFLEAMRFGLPVIAAAEKGALDVVEHEETGLLVEYGNVEAIANAIKRLMQDKPLQEKLVEQGFELVMPGGKFSFEAFCKRTQQYLC